MPSPQWRGFKLPVQGNPAPPFPGQTLQYRRGKGLSFDSGGGNAFDEGALGEKKRMTTGRIISTLAAIRRFHGLPPNGNGKASSPRAAAEPQRASRTIRVPTSHQ